MNITITINIKWLIKEYDDYGIGEDKCLYNMKRCKRLKQIYNNGSLGYKLNSKFLSLKKLKPLLYKPQNNKIPF